MDTVKDTTESGQTGSGTTTSQPWADKAAECDPLRQRSLHNEETQQDDDVPISQETHVAIMTEQVIYTCKQMQDTIDQLDNLVKTQYAMVERIPNMELRVAAMETFFAAPVVRLHYGQMAEMLATCERLTNQVIEKAPAVIGENKDEQEKQQDDQLGKSQKETFAQVVVRGNSSPQAGPSKQRQQRTPRVVDPGPYVLNMVAKTDEFINPVKHVYEALNNVRVHIAKTETKGKDGCVRFYKRKDYETATSILKEHPVNGKRMEELYDFQLKVTSNHSVRTSAMPGTVLNKLPFIREGKVDQKEAAKVLYLRNPTWFRTWRDIEYIEVHEVPQEGGSKFLLEIHTSREARNRMDREEGEITVDLVATRLKMYTAVKEELCYRCLQPGHIVKNCTAEEPKCKYCPGRHLSIGCDKKTKKHEHTCRTCVQANMKAPPGAPKLNTAHMATSTKCKFVRNKRSNIRAKVRARRGRDTK